MNKLALLALLMLIVGQLGWSLYMLNILFNEYPNFVIFSLLMYGLQITLMITAQRHKQENGGE
jgi:hypothetical protein